MIDILFILPDLSCTSDDFPSQAQTKTKSTITSSKFTAIKTQSSQSNQLQLNLNSSNQQDTYFTQQSSNPENLQLNTSPTVLSQDNFSIKVDSQMDSKIDNSKPTPPDMAFSSISTTTAPVKQLTSSLSKNSSNLLKSLDSGHRDDTLATVDSALKYNNSSENSNSCVSKFPKIVNIFHESDPIASRLEPVLLFSTDGSQINLQNSQNPQNINYHTFEPINIKNYHPNLHANRLDFIWVPKKRNNHTYGGTHILQFYLHYVLWDAKDVCKFIFMKLLDRSDISPAVISSSNQIATASNLKSDSQNLMSDGVFLNHSLSVNENSNRANAGFSTPAHASKARHVSNSESCYPTSATKSKREIARNQLNKFKNKLKLKSSSSNHSVVQVMSPYNTIATDVVARQTYSPGKVYGSTHLHAMNLFEPSLGQTQSFRVKNLNQQQQLGQIQSQIDKPHHSSNPNSPTELIAHDFNFLQNNSSSNLSTLRQESLELNPASNLPSSHPKSWNKLRNKILMSDNLHAHHRCEDIIYMHWCICNISIY